jgi:hypothetical protein
MLMLLIGRVQSSLVENGARQRGMRLIPHSPDTQCEYRAAEVEVGRRCTPFEVDWRILKLSLLIFYNYLVLLGGTAR